MASNKAQQFTFGGGDRNGERERRETKDVMTPYRGRRQEGAKNDADDGQGG